MKSKTVLFGFAALFVLLAFTVVPVAAVKPAEGNNGNAKFVNLVEKTPVDEGPYLIVDGGASGKLMYKYEPKPMFVFNANGMAPGEYSLISYAEPWGNPVNVLGTGAVGEDGTVHIAGKSLDLICNSYPTLSSDEYSGTGSKVWLVPSADLSTTDDVTTFIAWNPNTYLFETELINVGCTA